MKRRFVIFTSLVLTAALLLSFSVFSESSSGVPYVIGDFNGDGSVTSDDAIFLLRHVLFAEDYPIGDTFADFTGDEIVDSDDAIYLLRHVLFADDYPITVLEESSEPAGESSEPEEESSEPEEPTVTPNDYFIFTLLDNGTYEIKAKDTANMPEIVVTPKRYNGKKVTSIANKGFADCAGIKKIVVSPGIQNIGTRAFYNCASLEEAHIPESVTNIGTQIFYKSNSLSIVYYAANYGSTENPILNNASIKKVVFNGSAVRYTGINANNVTVEICDSVTSIGGSAFAGCSVLTSVTIPDSVTSIDGYAFCDCTGLTSVTIPDSVTSIGGHAFYCCTSLTSVVIPDSVTYIYDCTFRDCTGLTSVTIPDSVTSIGSEAFYGCTNLTEVRITDIGTWFNIYFGGYYSNPLHFAGNLYVNGELLTELVIPDNVSAIDDRFWNCTCITSVTIPDSVTSIGSGAYRGCTGLTSVAIPDSIYSIGTYAFSGCTGLTSVVIPDSVTYIYDYAFCYCARLTEINFTGTKAQWNNISKGDYWNDSTGNYVIHCTDGDINKE